MALPKFLTMFHRVTGSKIPGNYYYMNYQHKELASGRWFEFSLVEQLANVGAEVGRAINWRKKGNNEQSQSAFFRGLELLSLSIDDPKNRSHRLRELCRLYEVLGDYFVGDNLYGSTDKKWEDYFNFFNLAARSTQS
jgi:hypothetical protein